MIACTSITVIPVTQFACKAHGWQGLHLMHWSEHRASITQGKHRERYWKANLGICEMCMPLKAGFFEGPDALGANLVAASLANLDT